MPNRPVAHRASSGEEVVRAAIRIDPHTAQITVLSDPLPAILEGIPLQVRSVHVAITRPNFTFNPSNCNRLATAATFISTKGATSTATSPFYASNCASLPFGPTLTAAVGAHTSRLMGASLTISVATHPGEVNVAKTDLQLPTQLPARLTTLQKACLAATFQANPASCPPESDIGTATVTTPLLNSPLTGPIYLVSFGCDRRRYPFVDVLGDGNSCRAVLESVPPTLPSLPLG